ncbi:MAG: aldehyde dehydrogenase family protein [Lachnospiraceae bacterium]|nr:aldehyde dehydrogenase family protein [Lachnospiraceae bacterium]
MILANGIVYPGDKQDELLDTLEEKLVNTLQNGRLNVDTVLDAFDRISRKVAAGELNSIIDEIDYEGKEEMIDQAIRMMGREYLEYKIQVELGSSRLYEKKDEGALITQRVPLGVIFHIAAGNMDVLPIMSIAEGLLAGNINILKLPSVDQGLTVKVMKLLLDEAPELTDYIYVFDTPSSDVAAMRRMADLSDGISVWGGDEVVKAVRTFAKPGTRLIEWGHRLGFAYISGYTDEEQELRALAKHIMVTKQLLCSSCQVIYIDTEDYAEVVRFSEKFLDYLEEAAVLHPVTEIGAVAELSLRRYVHELDTIIEGNQTPDAKGDEQVFRGRLTSVTAMKNPELELSYMYGNVLVKPLPRKRIASVLRRSKGYLQTAGLICREQERGELSEILLRSGLERVTRAGDMSSYFDGEAHDGEYALMRYSRITNIER